MFKKKKNRLVSTSSLNGKKNKMIEKHVYLNLID